VSFFTEQYLERQAKDQKWKDILKEERNKSQEEYKRRENDRKVSVENFTKSLFTLINIHFPSEQEVKSFHRQISFIREAANDMQIGSQDFTNIIINALNEAIQRNNPIMISALKRVAKDNNIPVSQTSSSSSSSSNPSNTFRVLHF